MKQIEKNFRNMQITIPIRRLAFTLIEMLVVITIIVILAALLLPALARAKYSAKNVLCVNNQRQLALGVISYTSDYDGYYPARSEHTLQEAADVVRRSGSTTDYVGQLRPYFSESLKGTWVCPLASNRFLKGGATWYNRDRDIDSKSGDLMTSYSHYYGRVKQTGDPSYQKTAWGTGAFQPESPMRKVTDSFTMGEYWSADFADYNILLADTMWLWNSGRLVYTHQSFVAPPGKVTKTYYGRFFVNPAYASNNMNYASTDGSVHTMYNITQYDRDITLTRKGGSWGWAYMLPTPN